MNARHMMLLVALIAMVTGLAITGESQGQTTASGPYYATPSWDQQLPASTRFVVLSNWNNAAVLDRETGLVWQRTPGDTFTFDASHEVATQVCAQQKTGGRFGWRLPSVEELLTLADPSVSVATGGTPVLGLPAGHPFTNVPLNISFWTMTTRVLAPTLAWTVDFTVFPPPPGIPPSHCCGLGPGIPKADSTFHRPWCVRGPGPVESN